MVAHEMLHVRQKDPNSLVEDKMKENFKRIMKCFFIKFSINSRAFAFYIKQFMRKALEYYKEWEKVLNCKAEICRTEKRSGGKFNLFNQKKKKKLKPTKMIKNIPIEKCFFLDIETVPQVSNFAELSETEQNFGTKKLQDKRRRCF